MNHGDYFSTRKPGTIQTAFKLDQQSPLPEKFRVLKQTLLQNIGRNRLQQSWKKLEEDFQRELKEIKLKGDKIVPTINFSEISASESFSDEFADTVRKRGCLVVKNVLPQDEAIDLKSELVKYIDRHRSQIVGFPENNPQVWELYWSKSQVAARSHPNFIKTVAAVNKLWHAEKGTPIDFSQNLVYCDRLRIRQRGDTSFALNEHIDGGSVERWEDTEYRKCYEKIFQGDWEMHDPFDATYRLTANMDMYNSNGGCSMFRTFQGWMSLSNVKPGEGTLRLCPLIKHSTAYLLLRPLLDDMINESDMGGAIPGVQQHIVPEIHPLIVEAMVSIPEVYPGDCVFWHCDGVHAVEGICSAQTDSSVLYIPSTPLCPKNARYTKRQRYAFKNGLTPQDFPANNCEKEFHDRAKEEDLSELGKRTMGLEKIECHHKNLDAEKAVDLVNEILEFI